MKNQIFRTSSIREYRMLPIFSLALILLFFAVEAHSQISYKIIPGSQIKVFGTSNLHDWNMTASNFSCEGDFKVKDGELLDVNSLLFSLPVTNLKSKDDLMDTRAYKSLKASEFSKITFKLKDASMMPQQKIRATGSLTIGGVTNEVTIMTSYIINSDQTITCKGSKAIKMSDHKIKPPSFMMGALKTGNDVTIDFLLKLKKQTYIISQN